MRVRWIATMIVFGLLGCTRGYYQRQADNEVADILKEKDQYPEWKIEQYHVYSDPRARFATANNPNRPPMPPDDDASWKTSPHPQSPGHAGVGRVENNTYVEILKLWDEGNRTRREEEIEAAKNDKLDDLAKNRRGAIQSLFDGPLANKAGFLIELDQAAELGVINAREYQSIREDLYLVALPVTQQRFSFAFQWTAIENAIRQWAGPTSSVGPQNNWQLNSGVGATKLFSTGALLTLAFANSVVFNFNNPARGFTTQSGINLDIVQPLLQGGGRAVTLEPLTQAERTLFYNIRAYAHFRQVFYTSIAYGNDLPTDLPTAAGGGTTGSPISTLAALGIASTDVSGQFKGYLPSLFRQMDLAVDRKYVIDLEKALLLFKGFEEGGQVAPLQVDQVRSTLLSAKNSVLKDIQDTTNALDQFKLQLGVPTNMILVLDDALSRDITRMLDRYYDILATSDAAYKLVEAQEANAPDQMRRFLHELYTTHPLVRGTAFLKKLPASWAAWERMTDADIKTRLETLQKERRKLLDQKTDVEMQGNSLSTDEATRLKESEFEADLGGLEQVLRRFEARSWEKIPNETTRRQERNKSFRYVSYAGQVVLVWARNDQVAQASGEWPTLPPAKIDGLDLLNSDVEISEEGAIQAAMKNRFDLMNARAQVVDSWRQLAVTANALMGVLNVQYHLDSETPPGGTRPLAFSNAGTNSELIINGQLPLVRITERNAYKTALINYERARRGLMALEDTIAAQVRFDVRQLHLFAENYRIQQKVLESLYSQVESSLEVIVAPVDPDALKASGTTGQANAAALTSQYLGALGSLNGSQTKMYDIWLSYLATRMQLFVDLERMPLDSRGVWIDEARSLSPAVAGKVGYVPAPVQLPNRVPGLGGPVSAGPVSAGPVSAGPGGAADADRRSEVFLPAARFADPIPIEDR